MYCLYPFKYKHKWHTYIFTYQCRDHKSVLKYEKLVKWSCSLYISKSFFLFLYPFWTYERPKIHYGSKQARIKLVLLSNQDICIQIQSNKEISYCTHCAGHVIFNVWFQPIPRSFGQLSLRERDQPRMLKNHLSFIEPRNYSTENMDHIMDGKCAAHSGLG